MSRALNRSVLSATLAGAGLLNSFNVFSNELLTIVVTPTRSEQSSITVPAATKVITSKQIKNSGASSVAEVLRGLGGIYTADLYGDGTDASVSMRGVSSSSNVLIIIDGRRINNIDISSPDLNSVALKDIERIEVIQGSAGALYGDQAVGGVINIVTRSSTQKKASIEVAAGSYSRRKISAAISEPLQDDTHMQLSFESLQTDNYRDNNELNNTNLLASFKRMYDAGSAFVEFQQVDTDQELPGALTAAEVADDPRQSLSDFIDDYAVSSIQVLRGGFDVALNDSVSFEIELASRDEDRDIQQSFRGFQITSPSSIDNNQLQLTPKLIGAFPVKYGDILMTVGVDRIKTSYDSQITFIEDEQKISAGYGQLVVPVYRDLNITIGARKSRVTNDVQSTYKTGEVKDTARAKEIGLSYRLAESLRVFLRLDENFRFAKVDEFTYTSPGEELDNQKGKTRELGFELTDQVYALSAVVYQLELKDEIAFDPSVPEPTGSFFGPGANVNFDPTTHEGLTLDAQASFNKQFSMNAVFNYVDARFDSGVFADKRISGVPQRVLAVAAAYKPYQSLNTSIEWSYTGEQYVSGDNDNALPKQASHSVINANIQYLQGDWVYGLRINNLLNNEYIERANSFGSQFPAPELNVWLSARYNFE